MLTQIRERASGWLAWVIVTLITIPFALWGIQSYFGNPSEVPVATVNGEEIPLYAFQNEMSRQRQALLRQSDGNVDRAQLESAGMRNQVVESMISSSLMRQYISDHNYRLSDAQLKQYIESDPEFLLDGEFDSTLYRDLLRSAGYTTQSYEAAARQNAAIAQLSSAVTDSSFVTEQEENRLLALQAQTRKTDYVILPAERFAAEIEIDDAEAEQQYRDNLPEYEAPARIKVDYIELSVDNLAEGIEPSEAEINETYQENSERYKQAETRKASHILFSLESTTSEEERAEILADAEAVLAEARAGADFAELAQEHSGDPGSKDKGGDLGVVARGQMVAPFEDAVFDMTEDEIRGPVETEFGYHLIKLTELQEERQKPLEEVREEVVDEAKRVRAENLFAEQGEAFQNLVFEDSDSLTAAADELGLEIRQSDWFTENNGEGLAAEAKVRRAAFGEEVLNEDLNSAAIELGFDRLVALRKAEYEAAHSKTFDEVRDQIVQSLKSRKSRQETKQLGDKLVADLTGGQTDWDTLLEQQQLEPESLAEQRDQVPENLAALGDSVFSQAAPGTGETVYSGISLSNGDYAVYALKEANQGSIENIDESQRASLREQLLTRDGNSFYLQLRQTLRQKAEVAVDAQQIQNPTAALY